MVCSFLRNPGEASKTLEEGYRARRIPMTLSKANCGEQATCCKPGMISAQKTNNENKEGILETVSFSGVQVTRAAEGMEYDWIHGMEKKRGIIMGELWHRFMGKRCWFQDGATVVARLIRERGPLCESRLAAGEACIFREMGTREGCRKSSERASVFSIRTDSANSADLPGKAFQTWLKRSITADGWNEGELFSPSGSHGSFAQDGLPSEHRFWTRPWKVPCCCSLCGSKGPWWPPLPDLALIHPESGQELPVPGMGHSLVGKHWWREAGLLGIPCFRYPMGFGLGKPKEGKQDDFKASYPPQWVSNGAGLWGLCPLAK